MNQNVQHTPMIVAIIDSASALIQPPLEVHIPDEFNFNASPLLTRYITLGAHVIEHWGDELDEISINGATGGFLDISSCGYTRIKARETQSYSDFVDLLYVYKHNGGFYDAHGKILERKSRGSPAASAGGTVVLTYSSNLYEGYFSEFNWQEDATRPLQFTFDFKFIVQRTIMAL